MSLILDHILMGAPDLNRSTAAFAELAGVTPGGGGSHAGFGTRNELVSLGDGLFFEIIAPDPDQAASGHRAEALERLDAPSMHAFCLRSDDIAEVANRAQMAGIKTLEPVQMGRTRTDGVRLNWEILYFNAPEWGEALPFVIDWKGSQHPAQTSPGGCVLTEFTVLHPRAIALQTLYRALGIDVPVKSAMTPGYLVRLETPKGEVVLI